MAEKKELTAEEIKALQDKNKALEAELVTAYSAQAKAEEARKEAEEAKAKAEEDSKAKDAIIEELNAEMAKKDAAVADANEKSAGKPIIKVGKESYKFVVKKFVHNYKGKRVEVDEETLRKDSDLVKELIKIRSGVLVKMEGGK
ncbi:hypothetical protein DN752_21065 [Echinicola strongylocentroti]|uniref:Uncharacterized protein n=1 Tax=Echinicola strongylocentroti TaxID=1795355 RepID=A0A2Z4INL3_9BACT|nr:hypothetical protein [Echinicola strongylocentroti]AWW32434.1 hypothetical protein DN752_21065 [Echinicola strongylocentroti]